MLIFAQEMKKRKIFITLSKLSHLFYIFVSTYKLLLTYYINRNDQFLHNNHMEKEIKYGFIDKNGKFVIKPQYERAGHFSEGLAWVRSDQKYFYIDKYGRKVIGPIQAKEVSSFSEGLALFISSSGNYGYINKSGQIVIEPTFNLANSFHDGVAVVEKLPHKYSCIDKSGRFLFPPIDLYDAADFYSEGLLCVNKGTKVGFINKKGQFIVEPKYQLSSGQFSEGLTVVNYENKLGFINNRGITVIEPKFNHASPFFEGLSSVNLGSKWGFIDKTGRFIIEPKFEYAAPFSEGLAAVQLGGKQGYINKSGKFVIEPQFDKAFQFYGGYAYVKNGDKNGVIDKSGIILFEPDYNVFFRPIIRDCYHDGLAFVSKGHKWGYVDQTRRIVIDPAFDDMGNFNEGLARVGIETGSSTKNVQDTSSLPQTKSTYDVSSQNTIRKPNSGCYIATAVYGSYDCPEVWTLRRYRDNVLDNSWYGRLFIKCYYSISPTLVKWFGETYWFRNIFHRPLNKWIAKLNKKGFENTPYCDNY